jgi:hypothetical protein
MIVVTGNELVNVVNPAFALKPEPVVVGWVVVNESDKAGVGNWVSEDVGDSEPDGIKVDIPLVVHQLFWVSISEFGRRGRRLIALGRLVGIS